MRESKQTVIETLREGFGEVVNKENINISLESITERRKKDENKKKEKEKTKKKENNMKTKRKKERNR